MYVRRLWFLSFFFIYFAVRNRNFGFCEVNFLFSIQNNCNLLVRITKHTIQTRIPFESKITAPEAQPTQTHNKYVKNVCFKRFKYYWKILLNICASNCFDYFLCCCLQKTIFQFNRKCSFKCLLCLSSFTVSLQSRKKKHRIQLQYSLCFVWLFLLVIFITQIHSQSQFCYVGVFIWFLATGLLIFCYAILARIKTKIVKTNVEIRRC